MRHCLKIRVFSADLLDSCHSFKREHSCCERKRSEAVGIKSAMDFQMQGRGAECGGVIYTREDDSPPLIIIKYYGSAICKYGYRSLTRT